MLVKWVTVPVSSDSSPIQFLPSFFGSAISIPLGKQMLSRQTEATVFSMAVIEN